MVHLRTWHQPPSPLSLHILLFCVHYPTPSLIIYIYICSAQKCNHCPVDIPNSRVNDEVGSASMWNIYMYTYYLPTSLALTTTVSPQCSHHINIDAHYVCNVNVQEYACIHVVYMYIHRCMCTNASVTNWADKLEIPVQGSLAVWS